MDKENLLGVKINTQTEGEILEYILKTLGNSSGKYYIVTPNPEFLVFAHKNPSFNTILNNARLALPDGSGVIWAGKILGKNFKERVTGTDLVKNLCERVSDQPITVGFLGAGPKIAERAAECLTRKHPGLRVVFVGEEWGGQNMMQSDIVNGKKVEKTTKDSQKAQKQPQIDILFVALGFPKQEEWIYQNISKIPVRIAIGVGGAFDYISGKTPRAPVFVQRLGFEWLYRLIRQPWRLKRQLALIEFIYLVLKEKIKSF